MKILIVQDMLRNGGTERQSCLLANAFAAAGHLTALLTFRPGGALAQETNPGVKRFILQPTDRALDWYAPGLVRTASAWAPDIILCMGRMANCYGGWLARQVPRAAVVATLRTGKPLPFLFRRSLHRVRHVVANSHDSRQSLIDGHGVSPDRISVIHNALVFPSETEHRPERASVRARHGASDSTCVLLWVGMFRPEKNQREAIELVAGLDPALQWQLWLAGAGVTRDACIRLAAERGLSDRVLFLGFTRDPRPLYQAADLAILTSRSESLSNFLIESHAHGVPSVAYAVTGVPECGGLAIPRDDQVQFLKTLEKLMVDSSARANESARVRAYARSTFAPEHQTHAYLDLFSRLLLPPAS